jgi:hypothetical protein
MENKFKIQKKVWSGDHTAAFTCFSFFSVFSEKEENYGLTFF